MPRRRPIVLGALTALAAATALLSLWTSDRPLTAPLSGKTEIADMTWVEVRSAIVHGATTVLVPTGGLEQNGSHMVIGKHDRIVHWTALRIASMVGQTLVAPVVSFVPEGTYEPPSGHMRFPGTIGVSDQTFADLVGDIARSLKAAGFRAIFLLADHGQSVPILSAVAAKLDQAWHDQGVRVVHIDSYYADEPQRAWLLREGETARTIGQHAGIVDTSELLAVSPAGVDLQRYRDALSSTEESGGSGDPSRASPQRGQALLAIKIDAAVQQIRSVLQATH